MTENDERKTNISFIIMDFFIAFFFHCKIINFIFAVIQEFYSRILFIHRQFFLYTVQFVWFCRKELFIGKY